MSAETLLRECRPYVESQCGAEHMLDGLDVAFGKKPRPIYPSDDLLGRIDAYLSSPPASERDSVIEECARECDRVVATHEKNRDQCNDWATKAAFNGGMSAAGMCGAGIRALKRGEDSK